MTQQRKYQVNAALVGLALTALAVDKLFLSGGDGSVPSAASAQEFGLAELAGRDSADAHGEQAGPSYSNLDERLEAFDARDPKRDPFELSPMLRARVHTQSQEVSRHESEADARQRTAEEFKSANRLDGVLTSGRDPIALVNGQTIRLGQTIDGFELIAVQDRIATFQLDDVRVELHIPVQ